jgi:hypothetical protein
MIEPRPRPAAVLHGPDHFRNQRVPASPPAPIAAPPPPPAPKIRHYTFGTTRPIAAPLPPEPLRLTRSEIEAALVGSFTYTPHREEIIDRILLATARLDQYRPGSDEFRADHETVMRELRMLGLYPV